MIVLGSHGERRKELLTDLMRKRLNMTRFNCSSKRKVSAEVDMGLSFEIEVGVFSFRSVPITKVACTQEKPIPNHSAIRFIFMQDGMRQKTKSTSR